MGQALLSHKTARKGVQTAWRHWSVAAATSPEGAGSRLCNGSVQSTGGRGAQLQPAVKRERISATAPPPALALVLKTVCPIPRDPSEASSQEMGQDRGLVSSVVPTQVGRKA